MHINDLRKLIKDYFYSNPTTGRLTTLEEFENLDKKILKTIPDWYKIILMEFPLVDLEIGIPNDFGDEELKGLPFNELPLLGLTFISVKAIEDNTLNYFPDVKLINFNYLRIAEDKYGTQEGIYINYKSSDPEVRLIFHDFGNTGKEVLKKSELLLDRFSDIFKFGKTRTDEEGN
ncbi:MAG: hypothetical protein MUF42_13270 [Cytophagaceae bacterium]|jgi:hypothetical protein|nr:hypothetical protein [Cytophagaceae bacterium]